jgi:hypothetical protein
MEEDFVRMSHRRLHRCCFNYIKTRIISQSNVEAEQEHKSKQLFVSPISRYPFLDYAIQNMGHHGSVAGLKIEVEEWFN